MTSLNRQRANIVFSALLDSDPDLDLDQFRSGESKPTKAEASASQKRLVLTPAQVAQQEHIFHRDGALEWTSTSTPGKTQQDHLGTATIGVSLPTFFQNASYDKSHTTASFKTPIPMKQLTSLFANESYLLFLSPASQQSHKTQTKWQAAILLKRNCPVQSQLKAWMHTLLAARVLSTTPESTNPTQTDTPASICTILARTLNFLNHDSRFENYASTLSQVGWAMNTAALETTGGRRVTFSPQGINPNLASAIHNQDDCTL